MTSKQKKILIRTGVTLLVALAGFVFYGDSGTFFNTDKKPTKENLGASALDSINQDQFYKVYKVVDGDTVSIEVDGAVATVRLIGVNTPETVDPRREVECFGREASDFAKSILTGKSVKLEFDPTQSKVDRYDRLLAYVSTEEGVDVNKILILEGYAYEYTYEKPYGRQEEFRMAQVSAQIANKGLWNPATCDGKRH
ncbi:MAG: thermonuclease family protein [Patescibacteria group bacterium]